MWKNHNELNEAQLASLAERGYSPETIERMQWYVTADGDISMRHRPRPTPDDGLSDAERAIIQCALRYLLKSGMGDAENRPVWAYNLYAGDIGEKHVAMIENKLRLEFPDKI